MFYDNSEEVFPNWWDALDGTGEAGNGVMTAERPAESGGVVLQGGDSDSISDSDLDSDEVLETPDEDSGPLSRDGYRYRVSEINDPLVQRVSEAGDSVEAKAPVSTHVAHVAQGYDLDVVRNVWEFAEVVPGNDPDLWRKDEFGNWIYRLDYGRRTSEFGWEIFDPGVGRHCQGVYAMRPMQWQSFVSQYEVMG